MSKAIERYGRSRMLGELRSQSARQRKHRPFNSPARAVAAVVTVALVAALLGPATGDAAVRETPVRGGTIVYGLAAETAGGWCLPSAQLTASGTLVASAIYDTLVVPNRSGQVVPYLADRVTHDPTFTMWSIVLRDGVQFHDGSPLTAAAVRDNIEAWRTAPLGQFVYSDIQSTSVVDDRTVVVVTSRPWVDFDWFLYLDGRAGIVAPVQLHDAEHCATHLVGTGPFVLDHWTLNQELVVTRNTHYWQKDARGRALPYLDSIVFKPIADSSQRITALQGGAVDVTYNTSPLQVERVERSSDYRLVRTTKGRRPVRYFAFNETRLPFSDETARQAVALAIDREQVDQLVNDGRFDVASGPFDTDVPGFVADTGFPEHDAARARRLVKGYKDAHGGEFSVVIVSDTDPENNQEAGVIQEQLRRVGIDATVQISDETAFVNSALARQFDMLQLINHPGTDPDQNSIWWTSGSPVNFGGSRDATVQTLLDEGRTTADPDRRRAIYEELNRTFAQELPYLWMYRVIATVAASRAIRGLDGPALPGGAGRAVFITTPPVVGIWRAR